MSKPRVQWKYKPYIQNYFSLIPTFFKWIPIGSQFTFCFAYTVQEDTTDRNFSFLASWHRRYQAFVYIQICLSCLPYVSLTLKGILFHKNLWPFQCHSSSFQYVCPPSYTSWTELTNLLYSSDGLQWGYKNLHKITIPVSPKKNAQYIHFSLLHFF